MNRITIHFEVSPAGLFLFLLVLLTLVASMGWVVAQGILWLLGM